MDKTKKIIIGVVAVIAIVVIGIVVAKMGSNPETKKETENVGATTEASVDANAEEVTFAEDEKAEDGKNDKGNSDEETNFWDNVEVIEQTDSTEVKTDKNGETITESYPGEDDGWSPIVSPDDLEKNK